MDKILAAQEEKRMWIDEALYRTVRGFLETVEIFISVVSQARFDTTRLHGDNLNTEGRELHAQRRVGQRGQGRFSEAVGAGRPPYSLQYNFGS